MEKITETITDADYPAPPSELDVLQVRVGEMTAEIERLQSHIPEWLCDECNCVHPAPKNLTQTICKCGSALRPSSLNERTLESENARLQSIIDEANAQESITSIQVSQGYAHIVNHSKCSVKDGFYKVYARQIPAQQSPAVAVPENKDREMLVTLMSAFDTEHSVCAQCGHQEETMHMDSANMLRNYLADNSIEFSVQSPRITEQDAREFAASVIRYCNTRKNVAWDTESYMRATGSGLLTKLNEANHAR